MLDATSRRSVLRPVHRPDIECCVLVEAGHAVSRECQPFIGADESLETEAAGRFVDARHVKIEIRGDTLEAPGAIENGRAEPCPMGARAHDRNIAFMPAVLVKGPGPREGRPLAPLRRTQLA